METSDRSEKTGENRAAWWKRPEWSRSGDKEASSQEGSTIRPPERKEDAVAADVDPGSCGGAGCARGSDWRRGGRWVDLALVGGAVEVPLRYLFRILGAVEQGNRDLAEDLVCQAIEGRHGDEDIKTGYSEDRPIRSSGEE